LLGLIAFAVVWFSVACGLVAKSPEAASNLPVPLALLPFLGSGFVPTDSVPAAVRWFAEYQPFTPMIETLRGLLLGTPIGANASLAIAWCIAVTVACFLWAGKLYNRDPVS
jgi:ABC-2 type transport system permease protein